MPAEVRRRAVRPTLLLLHGTGGNENQMLPFGREMAGGGWNLLSPRGKVLEGGHTPRFFRRLAEGVFDEADVIRRAHELADFVADAAARYGFDGRRVFALGYSNGANIAAATLLLRPSTFAGAALLRPMVPLTPSILPSLAQHSRCWCAPGGAIPSCRRRTSRGWWRCSNVAERRSSSPGTAGGHELTDADAQAVSRWLPGT